MSCLSPFTSRATAMSIPPSDPRRTWRIQAVIFSVVVSGLACLAVHGLSSMCLGWHWHDLKGNHALRPTRRDRTGSIRMGGEGVQGRRLETQLLGRTTPARASRGQKSRSVDRLQKNKAAPAGSVNGQADASESSESTATGGDAQHLQAIYIGRVGLASPARVRRSFSSVRTS